MPRPKPKNAAQMFTAPARRLSAAARAELVELLGYPEFNPDNDTIRDVIPKIEQTLGLYVHGARHMDNIPRPADYREVFRPIQLEALKLFARLHKLSGYYRDQFKLKGADIYAIESALGSLAGVSDEVIKESQDKSSKGAPQNTALAVVTRQLRRIFRDSYNGPRTERKCQGAFQFLADWERSEEKFIWTALRSARIIPEQYREELPRLLRDPRCALPEDRPATIEPIARKVRPARRKQNRNNR